MREAPTARFKPLPFLSNPIIIFYLGCLGGRKPIVPRLSNNFYGLYKYFNLGSLALVV